MHGRFSNIGGPGCPKVYAYVHVTLLHGGLPAIFIKTSSSRNRLAPTTLANFWRLVPGVETCAWVGGARKIVTLKLCEPNFPITFSRKMSIFSTKNSDDFLVIPSIGTYFLYLKSGLVLVCSDA